MSIAKGVLLFGAIFLATPEFAQANIDPPWGFPSCPPDDVPPLPKVTENLPRPFVPMREQYQGIYLAVEQWLAPTARHFWPVVKFEEHQNWVRVYRVAGTKNGKPKESATINGVYMTSSGSRALSMRIDKCDGKISEMKFIKN